MLSWAALLENSSGPHSYHGNHRAVPNSGCPAHHIGHALHLVFIAGDMEGDVSVKGVNIILPPWADHCLVGFMHIRARTTAGLEVGLLEQTALRDLSIQMALRDFPPVRASDSPEAFSDLRKRLMTRAIDTIVTQLQEFLDEVNYLDYFISHSFLLGHMVGIGPGGIFCSGLTGESDPEDRHQC